MWYSRRGFTGDEEAHGVTIESKKATLVPGGAAPPAQNSKNTLVTKGQDTKPRNRLLAELGLSAILSNTTTAQMFVKRVGLVSHPLEHDHSPNVREGYCR
jgi:hypothetical protein